MATKTPIQELQASLGLLALLLMLCIAPVHSAFAMAPIQHWETGNGARVYYVPAPELPMVDVRIVFNAGSARDGKLPGLAALTNSLLDQGAGGADANRIAEKFDSVGASVDTGSKRDMAWVGVRTLTKPPLFDTAIATLTDVLTRPDFNDGDLERERQRMLVALQFKQQKPGSVADEAFYKALYPDHPYGTPPDGTKESVTAISRDDINEFYKQYYAAQNDVVGIVGAVDRAEAETLAERLTGKLSAGEVAQPLPPVPVLKKPAEIVMPFPSSQVHVLMGQPGMSRDDPDYFALYVGNYILGGGGLVSLLSNEIREERGLSYSIYSYFLPMAEKGPFELGFQTRADQTEEAVSVSRETLERYLKDGPTEKELIAAKKNITGGYPLRIDSNSKILEYLGVIGFYGLPLDYLERFNARIEAVTREQVRDAFRRHIDADRFVTVRVGGESG
jgi:zinc protease